MMENHYKFTTKVVHAFPKTQVMNVINKFEKIFFRFASGARVIYPAD